MKLSPHPIFFVVTGFVISVFFLFPVYDFLQYKTQMMGLQIELETFTSSFDYVLQQFTQILKGQRLSGTLFFGCVGAAVGALFSLVLRAFYNNRRAIENLQNEINRDISSMIAKGESSILEFKSSFRWDYKNKAVNKVLEQAVLKTLAAFMNSEGGSLLIGIADDGVPLGLLQDYATLKTKNRDGFEVAIMTAISSKLGAPQCSKVAILFHTINEQEVCHIVTSKSPKPVFVSTGKETKFFLRAGAGTRELNVQEATEYISEHW